MIPPSRTTVEREARAVMDGLRSVVRRLRMTAREAEKRVGLSAAQVFVLHVLARDGVLSLRGLSERTLTDQSSVSVVVGRLVEHGLVTRVTSPDDGRRIEIALTAAGRRLAGRAPDAAQDAVIDAVRRLAPRTRTALARGLTALMREMGARDAAPGMLFEDEVVATPRRRRARSA